MEWISHLRPHLCTGTFQFCQNPITVSAFLKSKDTEIYTDTLENWLPPLAWTCGYPKHATWKDIHEMPSEIPLEKRFFASTTLGERRNNWQCLDMPPGVSTYLPPILIELTIAESNKLGEDVQKTVEKPVEEQQPHEMVGNLKNKRTSWWPMTTLIGLSISGYNEIHSHGTEK